MLAACDRKVVGRLPPPPTVFLASSMSASIERRVGRDSRNERDPGPPASAPASATACTPSWSRIDTARSRTVALKVIGAGDDDTVDGLRRQLRRLTDCDLLLDLRQFVLERGDLRHSGFGHLQELVLVLDAELLGRLRNRLLGLTGEFETGGAGKRLDPANVRTDRPLADDPELANVAQRPNMRAATQFDRVAARLQHPHDIAVLVAKERDCTELLGGLHRGLEMAACAVVEHLRIDAILDLGDLSRGEALVVAEVETKSVGPDIGTLLLHVFAQHLAQRMVKDVGGSVVAPDRRTSVVVDGGGDDLARLRPPEPAISWTWSPGTPYRVSVTSIVTPPPVTVPVSPIWPPDSA